ncbi:hypothetical protein PR202_ga29872 [Eleusine coracana subsp. coracana]|uniref:Uncharacterized protein n=1 Tax=Eleusine coracana subsp. coracana TaxID=191504 RepID=A0AAV5DNG9_ELECO|nr:hypothetical protein PR202_ga29872 [Eleusine coracana subsp. coracana]
MLRRWIVYLVFGATDGRRRGCDQQGCVTAFFLIPDGFPDFTSGASSRSVFAPLPGVVAGDGGWKRGQEGDQVLHVQIWSREDVVVYERMEAIAGLVKKHNPDVIFFQVITITN